MAEESQESTDSFTQANEDEKSRLSVGRQVYEVGFHIVPTITESEAVAAATRMRGELEKQGASIIAQEPPKKIQFAYRIERSAQGKREKYTEGYFGSLKFEGARAIPKPLEETLRADKEILRSLIIETTREAVVAPAPRAVFSSKRLEGETIQKPVVQEGNSGTVSEEELEKSIEALVG